MGLRRVTWVVFYLLLLALASLGFRYNIMEVKPEFNRLVQSLPERLARSTAPWREEAVEAVTTTNLILPLYGSVIQGYGWQRHQLTGLPYYHRAIDIEAENGTLVCATSSGRVSKVYYGLTLGQTILIQHDGGWTSGYAHLSRILVKEGEFVSTGSVIGNSGSSGLLRLGTKEHLHFMLFYQSSAVNPEPYLPPQTGGNIR